MKTLTALTVVLFFTGAPGRGLDAADARAVDDAVAAAQTLHDQLGVCESKLATARAVLEDIAADHNEAGDLDEPVTLAALAAVLAPDEAAQLRAQADALAFAPGNLRAVAAALPGARVKVADVNADLDARAPAPKDAAAAAELKAARDRLAAAEAMLDEIAAALPAATTRAEDLTAALATILK